MQADDSSSRGSVARLLARPELRVSLGLVLPLLLALVQMWRLHEYTVDDAFISFRYARNLVDGHGLVYNIGERVEGYTNLSWTLMIAGALAAGLDPQWFTTVVGGAFGLGTIVLTYHLAQRLAPAGPIPCLATWLLATSPGACGHAVFGLETSMFTFLIAGGILALLAEEDGGRGWPWSGLIFALAWLTRPEAPLFLGLMMLHLGGGPLAPSDRVAGLGRRVFGGDEHRWRGPALYLGVLAVSLGATLIQRDLGRDGSAALGSGALLGAGAVLVALTVPRALFTRRNLIRLELFAVPVAVHLVWRFKYYGRWLPNTLTAKTGDAGGQFADGVRYFDYYLGSVEGPLVWLVFAACGLAIARREGARLAFASMVAAYCSYVMLVGGDWMLLGRYFVPLLPVFYVLLDLAIRELLAMGRPTAWAVLLAAPFVIAQRGDALDEGQRVVMDERARWDELAGGTARWFVEQEREQGEAARGAIALGNIGRVGWDTGAPVLDLLGLVDPTTAAASGGHRRKTGDDFLDHFYDLAPRYYVSETSTARCHEPGPPVLRAIQRDPRFSASYRVRATIRGEAGRGARWCIFERL